MVSFLWLSNLEHQFFILHFYQSLIYLAIILMLFYFEDRYAYMLGMMAPAVWLLLNYATGLLGGAARQVGRLMHAQMTNDQVNFNQVSLMAAVTAVLSVLMIAFCGYRWKREFAGTGKTGITIGVSFAIVVLYYGVLIAWFWNLVPQS
jgi:hypothetical protein